MNNVELIYDLVEHQRVLDDAFSKDNKLMDKFTKDNVILALFDELGEVNHELKANWCWWKKTQKPVDDNKLLEELADAWHFAIIYYYKFDFSILNGQKIDVIMDPKSTYDYSRELGWMFAVFNQKELIYSMCRLTRALGFTLEELHQAYLEKDKENYSRIERGY